MTENREKDAVSEWLPGKAVPGPDYAARLLLCFSDWEDGVACGELWSFYFPQPRPFKGLDQMLFAIEDTLNAIGQVQAWCDMRSGVDTGKRRKQKPRRKMDWPSPCYGQDELRERRGKLCTLTLRVIYRQHASMQGELRLYGGTVCFRSALELLHLLRTALEHTAPSEPQTVPPKKK